MSDYTIVDLEDVPDAAAKHGLTFGEVRFPRELAGAQQTGFAHQRISPGAQQSFGHRHAEAEEVYFVVSGSGRAKLDGEVRELATHDILRVGRPSPAPSRQGPTASRSSRSAPGTAGTARSCPTTGTTQRSSGRGTAPPRRSQGRRAAREQGASRRAAGSPRTARPRPIRRRRPRRGRRAPGGEDGGRRAAAAHQQPVGDTRPHARAAASSVPARSSSASPTSTWSPTRTAGTSSTPSEAALALSRSSSSRTPRVAAARSRALGWISQAALRVRPSMRFQQTMPAAPPSASSSGRWTDTLCCCVAVSCCCTAPLNCGLTDFKFVFISLTWVELQFNPGPLACHSWRNSLKASNIGSSRNLST